MARRLPVRPARTSCVNAFDLPTPEQTAAVDAALLTPPFHARLLPRAVPRSMLEEILAVASRAPSGTNTQPWQVHALTGAALKRFTARVTAAYLDPDQNAAHREEYAYYPLGGAALYRPAAQGGLGSVRPARHRQDRQGPHAGPACAQLWLLRRAGGLIFTIDRVMQQGSWLDYGMFLQNIMTAARAWGLHTCRRRRSPSSTR